MKTVTWSARILAAGALGLGVLGAVPAHASASDAASVAAANAPACIDRDNDNFSKSVLVINKCGRTMRVKVIIRLGRDSGCWTMPAGDLRWHNYYAGYYQKTVTC